MTNRCEMFEDETLFCNYTPQNMEQFLWCELPTRGYYLKVLFCVSNSQPLTEERQYLEWKLF